MEQMYFWLKNSLGEGLTFMNENLLLSALLSYDVLM